MSTYFLTKQTQQFLCLRDLLLLSTTLLFFFLLNNVYILRIEKLGLFYEILGILPLHSVSLFDPVRCVDCPIGHCVQFIWYSLSW